jgi:hypothetical protein
MGFKKDFGFGREKTRKEVLKYLADLNETGDAAVADARANQREAKRAEKKVAKAAENQPPQKTTAEVIAEADRIIAEFNASRNK